MCRPCLQSSAGAAALSAKLSDDGSEILVTLNMQCQLLSTNAACAPRAHSHQSGLLCKLLHACLSHFTSF